MKMMMLIDLSDPSQLDRVEKTMTAINGMIADHVDSKQANYPETMVALSFIIAAAIANAPAEFRPTLLEATKEILELGVDGYAKVLPFKKKTNGDTQ